jgi:hypothetical protein
VELSICCDREDGQSIAEEERVLWVRQMLEAMGLDLSEIWPEPDLTVEQKRLLRPFLARYEVVILEDGEKGVEIYVGDDLVGRWWRPKFELMVDHKARDPSKRLFYRVNLRAESVFDDDEKETPDKN